MLLQESSQLIEYGRLRQLQRAAGVLDPASGRVSKFVAVVFDRGTGVVLHLRNAATVVIGVLKIGTIRTGDLGNIADHIVINRGHGRQTRRINPYGLQTPFRIIGQVAGDAVRIQHRRRQSSAVDGGNRRNLPHFIGYRGEVTRCIVSVGDGVAGAAQRTVNCKE